MRWLQFQLTIWIAIVSTSGVWYSYTFLVSSDGTYTKFSNSTLKLESFTICTGIRPSTAPRWPWRKIFSFLSTKTEPMLWWISQKFWGKRWKHKHVFSFVMQGLLMPNQEAVIWAKAAATREEQMPTMDQSAATRQLQTASRRTIRDRPPSKWEGSVRAMPTVSTPFRYKPKTLFLKTCPNYSLGTWSMCECR